MDTTAAGSGCVYQTVDHRRDMVPLVERPLLAESRRSARLDVLGYCLQSN